jgi:transposase
MRTIKEILRLFLLMGMTIRQISRGTGVARSTVADYVQRARRVQLRWEDCKDLPEEQLEKLLFPVAAEPRQWDGGGRPLPDWRQVDEELRKHKNVTLTLLWHEYREQHPDGYGLSRFHELYSRWRGKLNVVMRQVHHAGEKLFVDFCDGPTIVTASGETIQTHIFVAVWGASNYTFVRVVASQQLENWIDCHVKAFEHFGCVPAIVVPDNLKAAVNQACRYEPELNITYMELAQHYGVAVIPARPYKSRDKAKVEAGVLLAQRWILARLRNRSFNSIEEINAAIQQPLAHLNHKIQRVMKRSRKELFELLDRPAAQPLPTNTYEFATWRKARIGPDYHVLMQDHYYSVPYQLIGEVLDYRFTTNIVEVFFRGHRVASHVRCSVKGGKTTCPEHMPPRHREHAALSIQSMKEWAAKNGPATASVFDSILIRRRNNESSLHSFVGIFRLANRFGPERVEKAAQRALAFGNCSYRSIKSILSSNLDKQPLERAAPAAALPNHENIRGGDFFQKETQA